MLGLTRLHFAAVVMLAAASVFLTAPTARAFTMENLSAGSYGNSRFADPDDEVKNFGQGSFGQNGPVLRFGTQPGGQTSPLGHLPGAGFAPSQPPPQPYDLANPNRE